MSDYIGKKQVHFGRPESAVKEYFIRNCKTLSFMRRAKIKEDLGANCFGFFLFMTQKSFKRVTILNEIFSLDLCYRYRFCSLESSLPLKCKSNVFLIAEFEKAAKIRKIVVYWLLISLLVPEL